MKRIICFVLCVIIAVSLVGCVGNGEDTASSSNASRLTLSTGATVSAKEYALKGEIYNCEFKLGTSVQTIKDAYHYGDEAYWGTGESDEGSSSSVKNNIDATPLEIYGEDPIRMITGDAKYYYHPDDEAKGISYIAYFGDAYGFRVGISEPQDIRNSIDDKPVVDGFADGEDLFFFFGEPEGVYQLVYEFDGKYKLGFYFENGKLTATTLCDIGLWA